MEQRTAPVSSIYCGSATDGPGLRCVVFFAGCNLRCPFCHNPETLFETGERYGVRRLFERLMRYRPYFGEGGGVTLSGGEPFLYPDFCLELVRLLAAEGVHTAAETNATLLGAALIGALDLIIADIKNFDKDGLPMAAHRAFLTACGGAGTEVRLTNVLVPGHNDSDAHLAALRTFTDAFPFVKGMTFLPFKRMCDQKYARLGIPFPYETCREADAEDTASAAARFAVLSQG